MIEHPEEKERLPAWDGKDVILRGYLFVSSEGTWVLSGDPHLRSCCVAKPQKLGSQIIIRERLNERKRVHQLVTLQGTFGIQDKQDDKGEPLRLYTLKNVRVVETTFPFKTTIIGILLMVLMGMFFYAIRKK